MDRIKGETKGLPDKCPKCPKCQSDNYHNYFGKEWYCSNLECGHNWEDDKRAFERIVLQR